MMQVMSEIAWEGEAPAEPCFRTVTWLGGSLALPHACNTYDRSTHL